MANPPPLNQPPLDRKPDVLSQAWANWFTDVGRIPVPPATPPIVTGSRSGGAALVSLLNVLAAVGVITNNTTA